MSSAIFFSKRRSAGRFDRLPARRGRPRIGLSCAIALLASHAPPARAHPHVWVSVECVFVVNESGEFEALRQSWTFDAMYASYVLQGLDTDGDGDYSTAELAPLTSTIAASLGEKRFFTRAALEGAELPLSDARDVSLTRNASGVLVMSFEQRPSAVAAIGGKPLRVEVRDGEYYVDFQFNKDRFATIASAGPHCATSLQDEQPPAGSSPDELMNGLINGPLATLGSAVVLTCE